MVTNDWLSFTNSVELHAIILHPLLRPKSRTNNRFIMAKNLLTLGFIFTMVVVLSSYANEADLEDNGQDMMDDEDFVEPMQEPPHKDGYRTENVMSFSPPNISEEEQFSVRIPANLICDGCKASAYQVRVSLSVLPSVMAALTSCPNNLISCQIHTLYCWVG